VDGRGGQDGVKGVQGYISNPKGDTVPFPIGSVNIGDGQRAYLNVAAIVKGSADLDPAIDTALETRCD